MIERKQPQSRFWIGLLFLFLSPSTEAACRKKLIAEFHLRVPAIIREMWTRLPEENRVRLLAAFEAAESDFQRVRRAVPATFGREETEAPLRLALMRQWQAELKPTSSLGLNGAQELKLDVLHRRIRGFKKDKQKVIVREIAGAHGVASEASFANSFNEVFAHEFATFFGVQGAVPAAKVEMVSGIDGETAPRLAVTTSFVDGKRQVRASERDPDGFLRAHSNGQEVLFVEFGLVNDDAHANNHYSLPGGTLQVFDHNNSLQDLLGPPYEKYRQALGIVMPSTYSPALVAKMERFVKGGERPPLWQYLTPYQQDGILFRVNMMLADALSRP